MLNVVQPVDLPTNKDHTWLERAVKAVNTNSFIELNILASEIELITVDEKDIFYDKQLWGKILSEISNSIEESNKIYIYKKYLKSVRTNQYKEKIKLNIQTINYSLEEKTAWEETLVEDTEDSYVHYLNKFSKSKNAKEARKKFNQIKWNKLLESDNIELYEQYIALFPNERYYKEAKVILKKLKLINSITEEIQNKSRISDKNLKHEISTWNEVIIKDTKNAYTKYLVLYPDGLYFQEATDKIDFFLTLQKKDAKAWTYALKINTLSAYQNYLRDYSSGQMVLLAQTIIQELEK